MRIATRGQNFIFTLNHRDDVWIYSCSCGFKVRKKRSLLEQYGRKWCPECLNKGIVTDMEERHSWAFTYLRLRVPMPWRLVEVDKETGRIIGKKWKLIPVELIPRIGMTEDDKACFKMPFIEFQAKDWSEIKQPFRIAYTYARQKLKQLPYRERRLLDEGKDREYITTRGT